MCSPELPSRRASSQSGAMLVELMIGLAIAAIAIAAAIASLLIVRDATGAVSDMSQ